MLWPVLGILSNLIIQEFFRLSNHDKSVKYPKKPVKVAQGPIPRWAGSVQRQQRKSARLCPAWAERRVTATKKHRFGIFDRFSAASNGL